MFCVGNWKMNPSTARDAFRLAEAIAEKTKVYTRVTTVLCPPFPFLAHLSSLSVTLGAQDCHTEQKGAFTGEVSPAMLKDQGCRYVVLGHSERGETDQMVKEKVRAAVRVGLVPIICVGEEKPGTPDVLQERLRLRLEGIPAQTLSKSIIVYEPVWAISTTKEGRGASEKDVSSALLLFHSFLEEEVGQRLGSAIPILYGGSVNEKNILSFLRAGAQGALVGGASLSPKEFGSIASSMQLYEHI